MNRLFKIGAMALVTGGGLYVSRLKENRTVTASEFNQAQEPKLSASLKLLSEGQLDAPLTLFRYTTCPFCGKVKAYLDYHNISHTLVEVEPMFKSQLHDHGYSKIPQLRLGGAGAPILVDSDLIVDTLEKTLVKTTDWKSGAGEPDVELWRTWAREKLVRYIVINVNRSMSEAWQGYDYIDAFDTIPAVNKLFLKVAGTPVMYMVSEFFTKPKLRTLGYEGGDARETIFKEVNEWCSKGIGQENNFHGGKQPDLADLEAYGVLQSIRGHVIYQEMQDQNPEFKTWLDNMDNTIASKKI